MIPLGGQSGVHFIRLYETEIDEDFAKPLAVLASVLEALLKFFLVDHVRILWEKY